MSDLGAGIRSYYEEIVKRVDPTVSPVAAPPRRTYTMRAGIGLALLVGLIVLLAVGLVPLMVQSEPDPVAPQTTVTPTTTTRTLPPGEYLGPSTIITSDGIEIGSVGELRVTELLETQTLIGYVLRELTSNNAYWPDGSDAAELLGLYPDSPQTGLTVEVSVDSTVQEIVESVITGWQDDPDTVIAAVVVDNETGQILAAAPEFSRRGDVFDPERLLPAASLAQVYTAIAALEAGYTLNSEWDGSSPQVFTSPEWEDEWTVRNSGDSRPPTILGAALYQAVNVVFANIGMELGPDPIIDTATRLGVDLRGLERLPGQANPPVKVFTPLEAVAIGAGEFTTFDAAAMFATISRGGIVTPPVIIRSITGPEGEMIYQDPASEEKTIDSQVIEDIKLPLAMVTRVGTGVRAGLDGNVEQIGKTGSTEDFQVAWYAGSTDNYTAAVSVVKPGPTGELLPLQDVVFNGQRYAKVFGGSVPATLWAEILSRLSLLP